MYTPIFITTILALGGITRAINTDRKNCESGPWVSPAFTGVAWAGTPDEAKFCEAGHVDGDFLTGIRVWRGDWAVWGLQFRFGSHDWGRTYGDINDNNGIRRDPDGKHEWSASDDVQIKLWNNLETETTNGVGWVQVWINGEKKLTLGSDHTGKEIVVDTGSQKIIAIGGSSGSLIDTLQFLYLESKIVSATMTSINFLDDINKYHSDQKGLTPAVMGDLYIKNSSPEGGINQTFAMTTNLQKETSRTVTSTQSHTIGGSISITNSFEVGLPKTMKVSSELTREVHYDYTKLTGTENTDKDVFSFTWTIGSTPQGIPPQTAMHCTAIATMGTFDSDYTAEMTAKLDNGKIFKYNDNGKFKSIAYANAVSDCGMIPIDEVPKDAEQKEASAVSGSKRAVQFRG